MDAAVVVAPAEVDVPAVVAASSNLLLAPPAPEVPLSVVPLLVLPPSLLPAVSVPEVLPELSPLAASAPAFPPSASSAGRGFTVVFDAASLKENTPLQLAAYVTKTLASMAFLLSSPHTH